MSMSSQHSMKEHPRTQIISILPFLSALISFFVLSLFLTLSPSNFPKNIFLIKRLEGLLGYPHGLSLLPLIVSSVTSLNSICAPLRHKDKNHRLALPLPRLLT